MTLTANTRPAPLSQRLFHAIPVIGWVAKDISRDINMVFYGLIIAITALVLAVKTWGLVALTLTAVSLVPVMFRAVRLDLLALPARKGRLIRKGAGWGALSLRFRPARPYPCHRRLRMMQTFDRYSCVRRRHCRADRRRRLWHGGVFGDLRGSRPAGHGRSRPRR